MTGLLIPICFFLVLLVLERNHWLKESKNDIKFLECKIKELETKNSNIKDSIVSYLLENIDENKYLTNDPDLYYSIWIDEYKKSGEQESYFFLEFSKTLFYHDIRFSEYKERLLND